MLFCFIMLLYISIISRVIFALFTEEFLRLVILNAFKVLFFLLLRRLVYTSYYVPITPDNFCTTSRNFKFSFYNNRCKFIITTYHSCYLLKNILVDLKIGDEAHHLVGKIYETEKNDNENETKRSFLDFHKMH